VSRDVLLASPVCYDPQRTLFLLIHVNTYASLRRILTFHECSAEKTGVRDASYGDRCFYAVVIECDGARTFGSRGLRGGRQIALRRDRGDGT
jgi:hypothetical protein